MEPNESPIPEVPSTDTNASTTIGDASPDAPQPTIHVNQCYLDGSPRPAKRDRPRVRSFWAWFAFCLSIIAVATESVTHVCAYTMIDPLPDPSFVCVYIFLAATILANEIVTHKSTDDYLRWRPALLACSYCGCVIAGIYSLMFVRLLPISIPALVVYGVGACAWSPFVNLVVIAKQTSRYHASSVKLAGRSLSAAWILCCVAMLLLVIRPAAIGHELSDAINNAGHDAGAIRDLQWLCAERSIIAICATSHTYIFENFGAQGGTLDDSDGSLSDEARDTYLELTRRSFSKTLYKSLRID